MLIYYSNIQDADESRALYPPTSPAPGSAFGVSLLALAYNDYTGGKFPKIRKFLARSPLFPDAPALHYSVSHSRTHVVCAISKSPVGIDTLDWRKMKPSVIEKLTNPDERRTLSFYDIWALRESLFKLNRRGDLRTMRFYMEQGEIVPPQENVKCRLYDDIPESSTAVSTFDGTFPTKIIHIPIEKLLKP